MSKVFKLAIFMFLISFAASKVEGYCKWVDADGVVHYAETCPEDVTSSDVEMRAPPSQELVEETSKRAEKIRQDTQSRNEDREKQKQQQKLEKQSQQAFTGIMLEECAEARWNLEVLNMQFPVYIDEDNLFHYNNSLHDDWYPGNRTYLDDQQRQVEIDHYTRVDTATCTTSEADIRARILKYREMRRRDICGHLRNKLELQQAQHPGIPSTRMRELADQIQNKCN
jgi:hypothetical protein